MNWNQCPYCQGTNLDESGAIEEIEDERIYLKVFCISCYKRFIEVYRFEKRLLREDL